MGLNLVATMRINGRRMVTVHTSHHLGGYEIARLLVTHAHDHHPQLWDQEQAGDPGKDMTRGEVTRLIQVWLRAQGLAAYLVEDDVDLNYSPEQALRLVAWACRQVHRLYPNLVDDQLTKWVAGHTEEVEQRQARHAEWSRGQ